MSRTCRGRTLVVANRICYEIRVQGVLDAGWSAWVDGLHITSEPTGVTVIAGAVTGQAALHGRLTKIRDVGLPLVSIRLMDPNQV
jgi:hypothetical protein